jgi:exosortase
LHKGTVSIRRKAVPQKTISELDLYLGDKMGKVPLSINMFARDNSIVSLKVAAIVAATLAVFYSDLAVIVNDALHTDSMSHMMAVPFLFAYLVYRKRKMLRAAIAFENLGQVKHTKYFPAITGILFSTIAILLYWYGSYTFTPLEYHALAIPIFIAGLVLVFFNLQTLRQLAFSIGFLVFLVPPPLELLYAFGSTVSIISSKIVNDFVNLLGIPCHLTTEYGTPILQITNPNGTTMSFAVDVACSGIYSLIGFLIFAVFIAYIMRDKLWKKIALSLAGFLFVYMLNITRIGTIVVIGYHYGEQLALQLFHLLGGWILIFAGTLLLLVFAEKILHTRFFAKSTQRCTECNQTPEDGQDFCLACGRILRQTSRFHRTDIIKVAAVVVTAIVLVSIQAPVFAQTRGPAQIMVQTPTGELGNTQLLAEIPGHTTEFMYRDRRFEEISGQDVSLVYAYLPIDTTRRPLYVGVEIGSAPSTLHGWEFCLFTWWIGQELSPPITRLDSKDVQILQNPPVIARYFAFQWTETNQTQVVLYWFQNSIFTINNAFEKKYVKISLISYSDTPQNATSVQELMPFATRMAEHWQPQTWSQVALLLSQESIYLIGITSALLLALTIYSIFEKRRQVKASIRAYQKLSKSNAEIIDAVSETRETATSTIRAIAETYKNRTGEPIETERLLQKLWEAERIGIVRSDIANIQDEPIRIWKSQMKLF